MHKLTLIITGILIAAVIPTAHSANRRSQRSKKPPPTEKTIVPIKQGDESIVEWESLRYGMHIHFGISTFTGHKGFKDIGKAPANLYKPTNLDVRQWIKVAKQAGMKFAILTVKHEAGFCLWDCLGYDYDVAASSVRTNVVAQFIRACKIEGIKPGVHYSVPDSRNEGHITFEGPVSPIYFPLIKRHTTELHKRYPEIFIHYFDVANRFSPAQKRELYQLIKKLNPNCIVSIDLIERDGEDFYIPKMGIRTLVNGWFWTADARIFPVQKVYNQFCDTIESGANYVLNVAPDKTGQIPSKQIAILMLLKKEIDRSNL